MKNPETSIEFQAVAAALALRHEPSLKMSKGFLDWAKTQDLNVLLDAYDRAAKREREILDQNEKMHAAVIALQAEAQDISHGVWTDAGSLADCLERGEVTAEEAQAQISELREQLDEAKAEEN